VKGGDADDDDDNGRCTLGIRDDVLEVVVVVVQVWEARADCRHAAEASCSRAS
jgi:hypothetical protein